MVARRLVVPLCLALSIFGCSKHPTSPGVVTSASEWTQTSGPSSALVWSFASSGSALLAGSSYGLVRTTDLGETWTLVDPEPAIELTTLGMEIFARGYSHVRASRDGGLHWFDRSHGLRFGNLSAIATFGTALVVGFEGGGLYRSEDGGETWELSGAGLPSSEAIRDFLVRSGDAYAGTSLGHVFRSTDQGVTWSKTSFERPDQVSSMTAVGSEVFVSTTWGVWSSTDDGASWQSVSSFGSISAFATSGTKLYAAGAFGLYVSEGGHGDWTRVPVSSGPESFYAIASMNGKVFLGTSGIGVLRCADLSTWTSDGPPEAPQVVGPPISPAPAVAELGSTLFAGSFGPNIFRSTNGGAEWKASVGAYFQSPHDFVAIGTRLFAAHQRGVVSSDDDGVTWEVRNNGLLKAEASHLATNSAALVVVTEQPAPGVFHSSDLGASWAAAIGRLPIPLSVTALTAWKSEFFLATRDAAGTSTIFHSTDDGASWDAILATPHGLVRSMAANDLFFYVAVDGAGVFASGDGGATWKSIGLSGAKVVSLAARGHRVTALSSTGDLWTTADDRNTWLSLKAGLGSAQPLSIALGADSWIVGTTAGVWLRSY